MEYGLYLARSPQPVFTGTAGQCRAEVDKLTDEQKSNGWTIGPIPAEPSPLPDDPQFAIRVTLISCFVVGVPVLLATLLYLRGCR